MGKVIIAAAGSGLARVVIDKLSADNKHNIIGLIRKDPKTFPTLPNVTWVQTTYDEKAELVELFMGAIAVLSFVAVHHDENSSVQKRLVDAAIEAGVPRFAPSEWAMGKELDSAVADYPWYNEKLVMREYLRDLNAEEKVIEYSLFQPGMFLDSLSFPHRTSEHFDCFPVFICIEDCRIVAIQDHLDKDKISLTSVYDIASVVAGALDYEGEWPIQGGFSGQTVTFRDLQRVGEEVRGRPFQMDSVQKSNLENGILQLEKPLRQLGHASVPREQWDAFTTVATIGSLLSISKGAWAVPGTWNALLPELKFVQVDEFVRGLWGKKQ